MVIFRQRKMASVILPPRSLWAGAGASREEEEKTFFRGVRQRMILLTMPTLPFVFFGIDHPPASRKIRLRLGEEKDVG